MIETPPKLIPEMGMRQFRRLAHNGRIEADGRTGLIVHLCVPLIYLQKAPAYSCVVWDLVLV